MRRLLFYLLFVVPGVLVAQKVSLNPTITPAAFNPNDQVTVTYNVTGTALANLSSAYIWVWIPGKNIDAKYNVNPASANTELTNNAKFTKTVNGANTTFSITFIPKNFFAQPICLQTQLGILIKGNDWSNGQSTDYISTMTALQTCFSVELLSPTHDPVFVDPGSSLAVQAKSSEVSTFTLSVDGVQVDQDVSITDYSFSYTIPQTSGIYPVSLTVANAQNDTTIAFSYLVSAPSEEISRPAGIIPGINYTADNTKVTLCLWAPNKSSVYVRGDFSEWNVLPENQMKKDGEFFWIELSGLVAGEEYAYQYLVNELLWLADPYADKILDPDDQFIPSAAYSGLKTYPQKALADQWYFNRLAVFQTNQAPYEWQATNYQRPDKDKLIIYEVLIRDFFADGHRNYQNLIDTLHYFKRLGVNAIELMPIMEFSGNDSWGYNPTFKFAPDKYYGTKNKLKEFIDKCHQEGIAVILDIVMNHHDIPNPYVLMDFDFTTFKPTANNKWFNSNATHPYNVFYDMNHESEYTKAYLDTVNHYWLNEYKVDGYRFDLSKGFTQNDRCSKSTSNEACFGQRDESRIAILKRMADAIWEHTPDAYVILEHFADNSEEKELAEYRANEGKGMMLWGNANHNYNQMTMGYSDNSNISHIYHSNRNWTIPHLIGYMESHDEERLMYKNLQFGNAFGQYDVKNTNVALSRIRAANTLLYTIPGPKMLWQFGELGYDISIDEGGRVSPKPVKWEYREDYNRFRIYEHLSDLLRLRNTYDVFTQGNAAITSGTNLVKQVTLKNNPYTPNPIDVNEMNVYIVANFDVNTRTEALSFPHTGIWYDYYAYGREVNISSLPFSMELHPGAYKIFTDVPIQNQLITGVQPELIASAFIYPNPVDNFLFISSDYEILDLRLISMQGAISKPQRASDNSWDISSLSSGMYIAEIRLLNRMIKIKVVKQ